MADWGVIKRNNVEDAWLRIDTENLPPLKNPLAAHTEKDFEHPGLAELRLMRDPEYFYFTCKALFNIQLLPEQAVILEELWNHSFPMYVASRGFGKSWLMAVYALLRCTLIPGSKVVIVGAAFRQAKVIFEYMDNIWKQAPILRSICDRNSGPRRDVDRCTMRINDSWAIAIPLGTGDKIRGLRAHVILSDEFACLEKNTLVETKNGLVRIGEEDCHDVEIYTGDNECLFEKPARYIETPPTDVYEITLENGYVIRCSEQHKVMTQNGWKKPLELFEGDFIESDNQYEFPTCATITEKQAWMLGILVSEGSVNDKRQISITTTDVNLKDFIIQQYQEYNFKVYERSEYIDSRQWNCKKSYQIWTSSRPIRESLHYLGLEYVTAINKKIPKEILKQPKHIIMAFLEGLFEGDGSCFIFKDRSCDNRLGTAYYSVSETLCRDVQIVLDKLGYDSYIQSRDSSISDNKQWFVRLNGLHAYNFASQLNIDRFKEPLRNCYNPPDPSNITWDKARKKWKVQIVHLDKKIQKRFSSKPEAQEFVKYIKSLPRFRKVKSIIKLDEQQQLYDYYLPITNSFYAGGSRQHNSIPPDIYETVVAGFAAVSSDPVTNVIQHAKRKKLKEEGNWTEKQEASYSKRRGNQSIISGTADYDFKHYADYWKRYCGIIRSKGEPSKIRRALELEEDEDLPEEFDYSDYAVIRIPYELIPKGFMDDKVVIRAKATIHSGIYQLEYGACFTSDSNGFFKRSLIEACVTSDKEPVKLGAREIWFDADTRGDVNKKYVYGIDPASEADNFSIVVLELHAEHTRVVYCWTTNRKDFNRRKRVGLTKEGDFYGFCARKIRDLMRTFPVERIGMDAQGGGIAVMEALHDKDKLQAGEHLIWEIIDPDKKKETDNEAGLHILELVQFAKFDWVSEANHGMRKDLEDRVLLFPRFDPISLELANAHDKMRAEDYKSEFGKELIIYDSLEDCVMEIEELKDELTSIIITRTGTGVNSRDRWDTPEIKVEDGKKGRMRKDRYSALVIANMLARQIHRAIPLPEYKVIGGFTKDIAGGSEGDMYTGPDWYVKGMNDIQKVGPIRRRGV